jgi:hypothetical protein
VVRRGRGTVRRAVFQAALDAGAPVRPVAITFRQASDAPARTAAFVGAQSLLDSVLRVVRAPGLTCELTVLADLAPVGEGGARPASRGGDHPRNGVPHGALSR